MVKIKCVKVRALFAKNKVRFARAEQLWLRPNNNRKFTLRKHNAADQSIATIMVELQYAVHACMPYIPACTAATMTNMTTINNSTATMTIRNFSSRVLRCQQPCWNLCPGVVADVAPLTYNTADDASITERLNDKKLHEATILTQRIIFFAQWQQQHTFKYCLLL